MSKKIICLLIILIGGILVKIKFFRKIEEKNTISNTITIPDEQNIIENKFFVNSLPKNTVDDLILKNGVVKDSTQEEVFTSDKIPNNILKKMIGNSIPVGEMIVNKSVAQEVLDIFKEVYHKKYPIEKIQLIDEYEANDEMSMEDNNTSAFCYRTIANTNKLSKHSFGKAIDINPLYNPYVVGTSVSPAKGKNYIDRSIVRKGTIKKGDNLYNA